MTTSNTIDILVEENSKRLKKLCADYNPVSGENAPGKRVKLIISDHPIREQYIPKEMCANRLVKKLQFYGSISKFYELEKASIDISDYERAYEKIINDLSIVRIRYDFCYWAFVCAKIKPKDGVSIQGESMVPFKLNYPQIVLLNIYEKDRLSNKPIRVIICKARQWGGSTLTQLYMAWIQLCHRKSWYSTIVAQTKTTSARILAMYSKMIDSYPAWALDLDEDSRLKIASYSKGSVNDYEIKDIRGNSVNDTVIQIGTVQEPDNIRGGDVSLIHYSEVGVWKDTPGRRPEDLIRSLSGGLLYRPYTMEVLESTPKGTGNFFHREWIRATKGESNRTPVFIPWYFIQHDSLPVEDEREFALWLLSCKDKDTAPEGWADEGRYYWWLWEIGATFEGINWYRVERKSLESHSDMASEAPSDSVEAFQNTGRPVFNQYDINVLRKSCKNNYISGDIISHSGKDSGPECLKNLSFVKDKNGHLRIWSSPDTENNISNRYLVVVDIGGRWKKADYSVITVFDRFAMMMDGKPEIVAEWRGHIDHDKLAWKAAMIAQYYHEALLVIESNTLETKDKNRDTDGNDVDYILDIVSEEYENLYARERSSEEINQDTVTKWGFHTNTKTKPAIVHHMIGCVRDKSWVERSNLACDEMSFYEKKESGEFGAVIGQKDDMVMTRAIGLYICYRKMDMPVLIKKRHKNTIDKVYNESTI